VKDQQNGEEAFEKTYGFSAEVFYANWLATVQKSSGGSATPVSAPPQPSELNLFLN